MLPEPPIIKKGCNWSSSHSWAKTLVTASLLLLIKVDPKLCGCSFRNHI